MSEDSKEISKIFSASCANTDHDVTTFEDDGMI